MPNYLEKFIKESIWIFAKTYAKTWPHEYLVQEEVENELFTELADYIDTHGYKEYFYHKEIIYI